MIVPKPRQIFFVMAFAVAGVVFGTGAARGDIYVKKDAQGVFHFTNVPSGPGYRAVMRERVGRIGSVSPSQFEQLIRSAARQYDVDPSLVRAVIKVESDFDARARSTKGAEGLMQLMPDTVRLHQVNNVYDPQENIHGGVKHLRLLLDRYQGDLPLTLAAYNAGIQAVDKHGGIPPFPETKEYVRRVLDYLRRYQGAGTPVVREELLR